MQGNRALKTFLEISVATMVLLSSSRAAQGQDALRVASSGASASEFSEAPAEVRALAGLVRDLESQVQTLNSQLGDLRMEQERASTEAERAERSQWRKQIESYRATLDREGDHGRHQEDEGRHAGLPGRAVDQDDERVGNRGREQAQGKGDRQCAPQAAQIHRRTRRLRLR